MYFLVRPLMALPVPCRSFISWGDTIGVVMAFFAKLLLICSLRALIFACRAAMVAEPLERNSSSAIIFMCSSAIAAPWLCAKEKTQGAICPGQL
ncbi:hypothetical protein [Bradyrhizobium elkanii]|uniref:hypothetical protein n=1 Tax=Bradyrhizobium elkanii TaxID=29448 RepID=UPI00271513E9|nr:hypothetical protein [Bradyrhizobium elkanii]WLB04191.1 hypothetical protein QNJ80_20270 [Bradyrhizobium elkanii]